MPALTLGQLQKTLADSSGQNSRFFTEPGASFAAYMNEVGPRVYEMGPWRDLLLERSHLCEDGYFSLDRDVAAIWSANVNDRNALVHSMHHDLRTLGNTNFLPEKWGLIDQGLRPCKRDIQTIEGARTLDTTTPITTLYLRKLDGSAASAGDLTNGTEITVVGIQSDGTRTTAVNSGATITVDDIVDIESITCVNAPYPMLLRTVATDADTCVSELATGVDLVRYRRFRVGGAVTGSRCHIVGKRAWSDVSSSKDVVYLGNKAAWKHALLGKVAEDNADMDRANFHWSACRSILDEELQNYQGAARPALILNLGPGALPIHNFW